MNQDELNQKLQAATVNDNLSVVEFLIENGADIHTIDNGALRWSAKGGNLSIVKILVQNGANIHIYNESPLRHAVENGHLDIIEFLIEQGAEIKSAIKHGDNIVKEWGKRYLNSADMNNNLQSELNSTNNQTKFDLSKNKI